MELVAPGLRRMCRWGGERNEEEGKRIQKQRYTAPGISHACWRGKLEGPQGRYIAGRQQRAGRAGPGDGHIRTTQSSEEVSLVPGAIDCLCSCTAGSGQGRGGGLQSIECRPALDGGAGVDEGDVVLPGAGGGRCHWLHYAGALRVGPQRCTAAE